MKLVIVESPTKAKTIGKFLPSDFVVTSSFGHVRDLPKTKMGIDTEHNFEPSYIVGTDKKKHVSELKALAKKADEIYFATDHDREGEAISWHLAQILGENPEKLKRIVFHEITKPAILAALQHPTHLNLDMVNAQQARRVLDRLVGYELSPFLWAKVARGLSAGRVQSVALKLIVEREREIRAFIPKEYWSIDGEFLKPNNKEIPILGILHSIAGEKLDKFAHGDKGSANAAFEALKNQPATIGAIATKKIVRNPASPFITSTLQQEANRKLGYSAKQIMRLAQKLYEGVDIEGEGTTGLITYMRTDSVSLAPVFIDAAAAYIKTTYGEKYLPKKARAFSSSTKNAQEAHEAIRPTEVSRTPESIKNALEPQQWKLYDLIWRRTIATQMAPAELAHTTLDITIEGNDTKEYMFRATGSTISFEGFLAVYPELQKDKLLPAVAKNDALEVKAITPNQHFTEPPARFSDATLVKVLEEFGIGRPSTYAPTIATLEERAYVTREERKQFKPTEIGEKVTDMLTEHFTQIVDNAFTAKMEENLDKIAAGETAWQPIIREFYEPFKQLLETKKTEVKKKETVLEPTDKVCPQCGKPIVIRSGRFGKFYACTGFPECKHTAQVEGQEQKGMEPTGVICPECKTGSIIARKTKRGKLFYSCNRYPECKFALWNKPVPEMCPECKSQLVIQNKTTIKCSNKECTFKKPSTPTNEDDPETT